MKFLKRLFKCMFSSPKYHLGTSTKPRPFPVYKDYNLGDAPYEAPRLSKKTVSADEFKALFSKMRGVE